MLDGETPQRPAPPRVSCFTSFAVGGLSRPSGTREAPARDVCPPRGTGANMSTARSGAESETRGWTTFDATMSALYSQPLDVVVAGSGSRIRMTSAVGHSVGLSVPNDAPAIGGDRFPLGIGLLLFVSVALAGNMVGTLLRYPDLGAAILYPPYAALTAVLVASRPRHWTWYVLASALVHLATHWPAWSLSWVLGADFANIARALVAAILLRKLFGGSPRLDDIRGFWWFLVSAVLLAPAVGATIGAANVVAHGRSESYLGPWVASWASNALTGLAMLPACIAGCRWVAAPRRWRVERARAIEAMLLVAALGATSVVAYLWGASPRHLALPVSALLPVLLWAALRFGSGGASLALTAVTFAAILGVDRGIGPSHPDTAFTLQVFVGCVTASMLCLSCVATSRVGVVRLFGALLASVHDQVAILDAGGVVLEISDSWRRFAETSSSPLDRIRVGDSYVAACQSAADRGDTTAAAMARGMTSVLAGERRRFELSYDHEVDGRRQFFMMTVEFLERPDGGAVVFRSNITARRQAQMEVQEQQRQLSHLARVAVLGQLSGAFAHELNQPLTAILSNAEAGRILLRRQPPDLEELANILRDIANDDRRAAEVIQRLRALLKRGERRTQSIDVKEFVDELLRLAKPELVTRQIATTVVVEPDAPSFPGDKVQVQQVLLNLLLNACEAMSGTPPADRRLTVTAKGDGAGYVHISITDSGPGIPSKLVDRLFEPFVSTKPDGLGLGLSISRTIVAAHAGRLWAENNAGGGTTMHCLFPVTDASRASRPDAAPATAIAPQP